MDIFETISSLLIDPFRKNIMGTIGSSRANGQSRRIQRCPSKTILSDWKISQYSNDENLQPQINTNTRSPTGGTRTIENKKNNALLPKYADKVLSKNKKTLTTNYYKKNPVKFGKLNSRNKVVSTQTLPTIATADNKQLQKTPASVIQKNHTVKNLDFELASFDCQRIDTATANPPKNNNQKKLEIRNTKIRSPIHISPKFSSKLIKTLEIKYTINRPITTSPIKKFFSQDSINYDSLKQPQTINIKMEKAPNQMPKKELYNEIICDRGDLQPLPKKHKKSRVSIIELSPNVEYKVSDIENIPDEIYRGNFFKM
ncbi:hypothetical protein AYI68_g277 [Smittium mucronatum]|uniref:Uncharacterized protein n=1 Tax=Smittium mucronatum TaxID=133383 RepID=A0A1R0H8L8_9FUNG|nr:hypothetical protein AYI68_g277 [Smittium mucronatum]